MPIGTTPREPKSSGHSRGTLERAWSDSPGDRVVERPAPPRQREAEQPATAAPTPVTPSLVASHRVRVMLWVQTSRCVPASSSRAIIGAPQNTPTTAGTAYTSAGAGQKTALQVVGAEPGRRRPRRLSQQVGEPRAGDRQDHDARPRAPRTTAAEPRNCRQVSQIIAAPPGPVGRSARVGAAHVGEDEVLEGRAR